MPAYKEAKPLGLFEEEYSDIMPTVVDFTSRSAFCKCALSRNISHACLFEHCQFTQTSKNDIPICQRTVARIYSAVFTNALYEVSRLTASISLISPSD